MRREIKRRRRSRLLRIGIIIAIILIALFAGFFAYHSIVNSRLSVGDSNATSALSQADSTSDNYTLLKIDSGVDASVKQSYDTLENTRIYALIRTSSTNKTISTVVLPASLGVSNSDSKTRPLYTLEESGGDGALIEAINAYTGVKVNHFVTTSADAVSKLTESLGGVELELPCAIDDPYSGNLTLNAGALTAKSNETYTILRARNISSSTDTKNRIFTNFLASVIGKLGSASNVDLASVIGEFANGMSTDLQAQNLIDFFSSATAENYSHDEVSLVGSDAKSGDTGEAIFKVNSADVESAMRKLRGETTDDEDSAKTTGVDKSTLHVEVRNGAGIAGAATSLKSQLESDGYVVDGAGNAEDGVTYSETLVVYVDEAYENAANLLVKEMGCGRVVNGGDYYTTSSNVIVIIGTDWSGT